MHEGVDAAEGRLTRVLAAVNGSGSGQHAAQFAERLARRASASYRALGVATRGVPGFPADGDLESGLSSLVSVSSQGIPGIEIVRAAGDWGADLVVMGRRPRLDPHEALGNTIEAVLRRLDKPCLLIPPWLEEIHRMLIALDGTLRGLGTLTWADKFARLLSLHVGALYVQSDPLSTGPAERLQAALDGFSTHPSLQIRSGPPVETILAGAESERADLLVVGVRRGGPPGEAGSGHIGKGLLRRAPMAILTVPI